MLLNYGVEKTLESPLDCKEIQPVHPQGNQSWIFIGSTDAEVEAPVVWPPDAKSWLIWKDPDAGKRLRAGEGGDRGWDGWMASQTQWTWVWVNSRSWWWIGRPACYGSWVAKSQTQLWTDWSLWPGAQGPQEKQWPSRWEVPAQLESGPHPATREKPPSQRRPSATKNKFNK